jgi:sulfite exporter TauE/SafE
MNMEPLTLGMAFIAGIMGSGHCVGMCGGLALLPTAAARESAGRLPLLLGYNGFRLVSYALLGAGVGATGAAIGKLLDVSWWSLLLGDPRFALAERLGGRLWKRISPLAMRLNASGGRWRMPGLGLLWGLLPCGLVYSMLLATSVSGSAVQGAGLMLAFGAGTLPSMLGMGYLGQAGLAHLRKPTLRRVAGAVLIVGGIWLAAWPIWHRAAPAADHGHHSHIQQAG